VLVLFALANAHVWIDFPHPSEFDAWTALCLFISYFIFIPTMIRSGIPFSYVRVSSAGLLVAVASSFAADYLGGFSYLISCVALLSASGYILARATAFGQIH
jgi:hypothetical protein